MTFQKIFHSGNTHRLTIPRWAMHALKATPGDLLQLRHSSDGVIEVTNASARQRAEQKRKRK